MNKSARKTGFNATLLAGFLLSAGCVLAASASADVPRFFDPPFIQTNVYSIAMVTADFNNDGIPDAGSINSASRVGVTLSNGDGTFQPTQVYVVGDGPSDMKAADLNGDGTPDLVVTLQGYPGALRWVVVLLGNGDGTFSPSGHSFKFGVATALADFNNDGALDVADVQQPVVSIFFNTGGSQVSLISSENPAHAGEKVTFHARVSPKVSSAVPYGTVEFLDRDQALGTAALVDGKARFTTSSLSVGRHRIRANYSGDAIFVPRKSKPKRPIVQP